MARAKREALHPKREANPNARCPKHPDKDWHPLVKQAWDAGWWVERRRKYIYCFALDGDHIVKVPMTPSGSRTLANKRRDFRAAGLRL